MFDYTSAFNAGASEDQVLSFLNKDKRFDVDKALKSGATKRQIIEFLSKKSATQSTSIPSEPKKNILEKTSETISKGMEVYKNLPGIKQARQVIGGTVGILGGAIGGVVGGAGQLVSNIKNDKSLFQGVGTSAVKIAKETSSFGKEIGSEGTAAAPMGALGRVPNLILGAQQIYEGGKAVKTGLETGDTAQAVSGGIQTGFGALGLKFALGPGKQGVFINPKAVKQVKAEWNYIRDIKPKPITDTPVLAQATKVYREVLKPTQSEVKNIEIRKGQNIDDAYKFMANEEVTVGKSIDNRLDTIDAVTELRSRMDLPEEQLNAVLESKPNTKFNLLETADKVKSEIDNTSLSALEKQGMKADVDDIISAEIKQRYGAVEVNAIEYNNIKRGLWKMGYNQLRPTANKVARKIGYVIKEDIGGAFPEAKPINERLGSYANSIQLLENAHGRVIRGGQIGKALSGIAGTVIGNTINIPIVGPVIGKMGGEALFDWKVNPERLTTKYSNLVKAEKAMPGSIIQKTVETAEAKNIKPGMVTENVARKIAQNLDDADIRDMESFIDYVRLKKPENVELEVKANSMAEAMGLNPDKSRARLANDFEDILSTLRKPKNSNLE